LREAQASISSGRSGERHPPKGGRDDEHLTHPRDSERFPSTRTSRDGGDDKLQDDLQHQGLVGLLQGVQGQRQRNLPEWATRQRQRGAFSGVKDISEIFGTYFAVDGHAGAPKSAEGRAMTKGKVSLALRGTGRGFDLGFSFGAFTIERK
jgi:hypothetical protein